jgi:hypothetical protein
MDDPDTQAQRRSEATDSEDLSESPDTIIDLTTEANQAWLDEPNSWTPYRLLDDEQAKERRDERLDEAYRNIVGEEPE